MAVLVNHLRNATAQNAVLAIASGRHIVDGHLVWTYTTGTQITARHAFAKGIWEGVEGAWFKGLNIPAADYVFNNGTQINSPISTLFGADTNAHTGTVVMDVKYPTGVGEPDTAKNPPEGFAAICKCEKFPDFNNFGQQIIPGTATVVAQVNEPLVKSQFTYTANPARVVAGWLLGDGGMARDDIEWLKWTAWRNFLGTTETADYRTLPNFDGFGLTARYYSGTNLLEANFIRERTDPVIQFNVSDGSPAVGVPANSFSVRWEGFISTTFTANYTFKIIHDNGARLWVNGIQLFGSQPAEWTDDGLSTPGTHTGTASLQADTFYPIKVEWNNGGVVGEFQLFWSASGKAEEIIPAEAFYPLPRPVPRYEAHVAFSTPTTVEQMIDAVLRVSNSIRQDIDGKIVFTCMEELVPTFDFDETLPEASRQIMRSNSDGLSVSTLKLNTTDRRVQELQNVFEAKFRDLDSQFLEEPIKPIQIKVASLITEAGREITGGAIELFNMNRWQVFKCLQYIVNRITQTDPVSFDATARCYTPVAGDLVRLKNAGGQFNLETYQIAESADKSPQETSRERSFSLRKW